MDVLRLDQLYGCNPNRNAVGENICANVTLKDRNPADDLTHFLGFTSGRKSSRIIYFCEKVKASDWDTEEVEIMAKYEGGFLSRIKQFRSRKKV